MSKQYHSIENCLFNAFANEGSYCDPQAPEYLWAIHEGVNRLRSYDWQSSTARKEHICTRGCEIKPGQVYFKYNTGGGWGDYLKFCAGCTAMLLYFRNVEDLPVYMNTHWDIKNSRAVRLKDEDLGER